MVGSSSPAIVGFSSLVSFASRPRCPRAASRSRSPAIIAVIGSIAVPDRGWRSVVVAGRLPGAAAARAALAVALLPAVVVGLAIVVLSQVFTLLVPRLVGVAALAGSLASAFIALAWLSFTFQALLYGAAWVRVRDETRPARDVSGPGRSRTGGRTGRWRRVTVRS